MKWFRIVGLLLALAVYQRAQAQTATVTWTTSYQTIAGFGASNHGMSSRTLLNSYDSLVFQTLGFSLLRTGTPETDACNSISAACATAGDSIADMQACVANGCQVWATSWTPPAEYKTNGNIACSAGSGKGSLASASQAAFATYLSNYIASLKTYYGITLYAISVQNEPEVCQSYDSSLMSAAQFDSFIKTNLGPTMQAAGQWPTTQIMMAETSGTSSDPFGDFATHANTCMTDSACASFVNINAFHGYGYESDGPTNPNPSGTPQFWETETGAGTGYGPNAPGCTDGEWCPGIADAMMWASLIHYNIGVVGENSWSYWQYVDTYGDNEPLISPNQSQAYSIRLYVFAQWAKFVKPGWVRIEATGNPSSGVYITAFKETASGNFAIVAVNQNSSPLNVEFSLAGFPSVTSVTPTLTSASARLEDQASVNILGDSFSYSLPGTSVTTFHGIASSSSTASKAPAAPTSLAATVN
jgi:glucuronoarabinoxylan endo-1,4-beta-xylanase